MMCLPGGQEVKPVRGMFEDGVGGVEGWPGQWLSLREGNRFC